MRRGNAPEFLYDSGTLLGINLSADFCAEHEWGIKQIVASFGMKTYEDGAYGREKRRVHVVPETLYWVKEGYVEGFIFVESFFDDGGKRKQPSINSELTPGSDWTNKALKGKRPLKPLGAAWSDCDFGAVSSTEYGREALRQIYDALRNRNAVIFMSGGGNPFGNSGLCIAIADRLSADVYDTWDEHDRAQHQLKKDVAAMGIEEELKQAGRRYYALKPRRQEDGSIRFWLNPMDQHLNNFGWFAVEDLRAWIKGEGPIPVPKK